MAFTKQCSNRRLFFEHHDATNAKIRDDIHYDAKAK
jgi:hypothetical protein